jgi:DNA-binding transcriptional LysR family regulator
MGEFRAGALRLGQFRSVLAIAEHGSLLKAARALGTSQPAVTKVLREVEQAVGVPLFDRLPRGVLANDYGRAFIARASLTAKPARSWSAPCRRRHRA